MVTICANKIVYKYSENKGVIYNLYINLGNKLETIFYTLLESVIHTLCANSRLDRTSLHCYTYPNKHFDHTVSGALSIADN